MICVLDDNITFRNLVTGANHEVVNSVLSSVPYQHLCEWAASSVRATICGFEGRLAAGLFHIFTAQLLQLELSQKKNISFKL